MYKTTILLDDCRNVNLCHLYYRKNRNSLGDQGAKKPILITEEVTQGCKQLHNEKVHNLYSSLSITSENEMQGKQQIKYAQYCSKT